MEDMLSYVKEISEFRFEKFELEIEKYLQNKTEEERLTFLYAVKKEIKEIKKELMIYKSFSNDFEEIFHLKNRIKKLKKKVFLINHKIRLINPIKEKITKTGMLTNKQKRIRNDIFNGEDISNYDIKDKIATLDYLIVEELCEENYDIIIRYSHEIALSLSDYILNNEGFKEFFIFLNDLKNRITRTLKDTQERIVLKKVFNEFRCIYQMYKNKVLEENQIVDNNSSFADVIIYWLSSEENYNYLKKMIERKSDAVNTMYNNKHIIFYILDYYIHNFKRMVNDKKSDYVNLKYIEEVYYLFTKNPALKLSKEDKEQIDAKLKNFEEYIDLTLIKQKRKNYAKQICKNMKSSKFYNETLYYEFPSFNDDELGYYQVSITNNINNYTKDKEAKEAYLYDGNVYNIKTNEDGNIILNIYAISFSEFIVKDSEVDKYLERCEMLKEDVDSFFKKELVFQNNSKYAVIDYELEFYPSGKFHSIKVKKDIVEVKNITKEKHDELEILYKKSIVKNDDLMSSLKEHFENILQKAYIDFLQENSLPFIYYGKTMPNKNEIEKMINDLSSDLYDMNRKDYEEVINIISNEIDIYHYSNLPIHNAKYELELLNPISFLGIENQRMLADLHFNRRKLSSKERLRNLKMMYMYKYYYMVSELNSNLGYVDSNIIKQSKGKIKNRLRL